jgi:cation transport regulator ChaB
MPFATNDDVPADVRGRFSGHCLTVWRQVWNDTFDRHHDEGRAFATAESAGQSCKEARKAMADQAVKFVKGSDYLIEGLAIPFGGPDSRDLDGEYFTKETDLCISWLGEVGRPLLYDHGTNKRIKRDPIGRQVDLEVLDDGVWIKAELDKNSRYRAAVSQLIHEGGLGFSSGAMAHLVTKSSDGHLETWPWVEESLTPTPAHPGAVAYYVKSAADVIKRLEAADVPTATLKAKLVERFDEWSGGDSGPESFDDHSARLASELGDYVARAQKRYEQRAAKVGREFSETNLQWLESLDQRLGAVEEFRKEIQAAITRVRESSPDAKALHEAELELLLTISRLNGAPV